MNFLSEDNKGNFGKIKISLKNPLFYIMPSDL